MPEEIREASVEEIQKQMKELLDNDYVKNLIKNNEIAFDYEGIEYKVRKLNYKERQELNQKRILKLNQLLEFKDDKGKTLYKTERELVNSYKIHDIDVDKMDDDFSNLDKKKNDLLNTLGQMLKDNKTEDDLKKLKDEVEKIVEEQQLISIKRTNLLESSIETQLLMFVYGYHAYLGTEKKVDDKWVRLWNNYDEFEKSDDYFVDRVLIYVTLLTRET